MNNDHEAAKWDAIGRVAALATLPLVAFIALIIHLAWPQFEASAPWVLFTLYAVAAIFVAGAIYTFFSHQRKMSKAKLERYKIETLRFAPDFNGNYEAYLDLANRTFIQPTVGNMQVPVPQTYSPHITYHNDVEQVAGLGAQGQLPAPDIAQPTQEYVISQLHENGLQVCLGVSTTTGKPFVIDLIEGTHYRIIGASGMGKSCLAASILDQATKTNDPERLQIALLDLEHKTSKLFEHLPHVAELQVGRKRVECVATTPDEVGEHFAYLRKELDRRKVLSEYDLQAERFMLIYVEEFLSLRREIDPKLKEQMLDDFSILAMRGRKYKLYLLACAQVDYSDKSLRDAQNQFNVNASFSVKPRAAQAAGFSNYDLLKQNFEQKQRGQLVLETTGYTDIMLAPEFDVKQKVLELERSRMRSTGVHDGFKPFFKHVQTATLNGAVSTAEDRSADLGVVTEVLKLIDMGWSKQEIVERVWNCSKGGSKAWQDGSKAFDSILSRYRGNEQPESEQQ